MRVSYSRSDTLAAGEGVQAGRLFFDVIEVDEQAVNRCNQNRLVTRAAYNRPVEGDLDDYSTFQIRT